VTGATGPVGATGPAGETGARGATGSEGTQGKEGPEGKNAFSAAELETLKGILQCVRYVSSGVAGRPTVQFSGCNVQIVNGENKTATANGAGNLVIGYDERPREQTGSHNLILGEEQKFTSYGGVDAGRANTIGAPFASVGGGHENKSEGEYASVSGGEQNTATSAAPRRMLRGNRRRRPRSGDARR
jgi:hypothetical protein